MRSSVNGTSIDYSDSGRGPALLLIHGFPLDRTIWSGQIQVVAGSYRVIAPDLRGHGRSPAKSPVTMDDYARDLLGLMDDLKIERFAAAGHSMGGYILFAMARLAPKRLSHLALVSTRALADPPEAKKNREESAQRVEREGVKFIAESMAGKLFGPEAPDPYRRVMTELMSRAPAAGVAGALRAMAGRPDSTPQLGSIAVPTLVIAGRGDKIVPPAESEAMAKAIPGSNLVWAEQSGHMPMTEEPALVTKALSDLLAR